MGLRKWYANQWRIQDFPVGGGMGPRRGAWTPQGGYVSKKFVCQKRKKSGPLGGGGSVRRARTPRSANANITVIF